MGAPLDLRGLEQFRASALLDKPAGGGLPLAVEVALIDFDPLQPRGSVDPARLTELAGSIAVHGVLEPVTLRRHPEAPGRYLVNRGERRVRACREAGLPTVPAWLDERVDRYAQAVENLHRDDLSPFDLARFVAEREREGDSRSTIAKRLGKPASFITEVAGLVDAPDSVRAVYENGRSRDTRVLYQLARTARENPEQLQATLAGEAPVTRVAAASLVAEKVDADGDSAGRRTVQPLRRADALLIEHAGQRGRLALSGWPGRRTGEVRFEDGSRKVIELAELKVISWTGR